MQNMMLLSLISVYIATNITIFFKTLGDAVLIFNCKIKSVRAQRHNQQHAVVY